jgi:hypothetical protein
MDFTFHLLRACPSLRSGRHLTHCTHNWCCGSLTTKVHLVPLFLLRKTVRSCFARCFARFAPPCLLLLHKSIAVPDGFCIAKKTIGIREIRACPLRGRHIPGFASLGASHASPLHAAHAPPPILHYVSSKRCVVRVASRRLTRGWLIFEKHKKK